MNQNGRPRMVESPRRETWRKYKASVQCRAKGCANEPIPGSGLCGRHEEMAEEGEAFLLKPIPHANAQRCAKSEEQKEKAREAAREVLAEMKRKREEREAKQAEYRANRPINRDERGMFISVGVDS